MTMELLPVTSSNIAAIGYDENSATLTIQFKTGAAYEYFDVPQFEFDNLVSADSIGSYANQHIYKKYRENRIG